MTAIPPLTWRQWRRMWLVQVTKWLVFVPGTLLWLIGKPLLLAVDWAADRINAAYVDAYNADMARLRRREMSEGHARVT